MPRASITLVWLTLVGVIWLQAISGTNATFPAYSSQLRNTLKLSQLQINNLIFASDAGKLFGWLSGVAAKKLDPDKRWTLPIVLILGAFLGFISYGFQFLFITGKLPPVYGWLFFFTVVSGTSICWINTVCQMIIIQNFPLHKQVVAGITSSYQGLSAKIYTDIVNALFAHHRRAKGYLLLNGIVPMVVCIVLAPLVRRIDVGAESDHEQKTKSKVGFNMMLVITILTGVYSVVISSLGSMSIGLSPSLSVIFTGVSLLIPLTIPIVEKIREKLSKNRENRVFDNVAVDDHNAGADDVAIDIERGNNVKEEDSQSDKDVKEEIGWLKMMTRLNFYLYFFLYLLTATIGLVFLSILGQIAESRGSSRSTAALVSLSSAFVFFGRVLPSLLDYYFSRSKYMVSRTAFIALLASLLPIVFFSLASSANFVLFIGTAIIGLCAGAITSISVSVTAELFGKKSFPVNHNVVIANIAIGSGIFNNLSGVLYRVHANQDGRCIGMNCYRTNFILWGCVSTLGASLAIALYARTRNFYSQKS